MVLFRVQEEVGNRWAQIARQLPGRTDNNIKNFFNSALRKALRKVNLYVGLHKKEEGYRNVKEFKQATLSKIIAVAERKYENKINLRGTGVEHDARGKFRVS
jgi:myb proto-oncogene protein